MFPPDRIVLEYKMDLDGQLISVCFCEILHFICMMRAAWEHFVNVGDCQAPFAQIL